MYEVVEKNSGQKNQYFMKKLLLVTVIIYKLAYLRLLDKWFFKTVQINDKDISLHHSRSLKAFQR